MSGTNCDSLRENAGRVCGEVSQVLSEIPTTGKAREAKLLGESLFAIGDEEWKGKKVIAWANEFTLEPAEADGEY